MTQDIRYVVWTIPKTKDTFIGSVKANLPSAGKIAADPHAFFASNPEWNAWRHTKRLLQQHGVTVDELHFYVFDVVVGLRARGIHNKLQAGGYQSRTRDTGLVMKRQNQAPIVPKATLKDVFAGMGGKFFGEVSAPVVTKTKAMTPPPSSLYKDLETLAMIHSAAVLISEFDKLKKKLGL